jgi:hypothetical protein
VNDVVPSGGVPDTSPVALIVSHDGASLLSDQLAASVAAN